jgi:hypothetical protein
MKLIKTYLRSTMSQDRLNGLALASINKEIKVEPSEIINVFASKRPRRMNFGDWSNDEI